MSQHVAVDYVFRDYVFTGNAFTSHDLCTYSVLFFLPFVCTLAKPYTTIHQPFLSVQIVSKIRDRSAVGGL